MIIAHESPEIEAQRLVNSPAQRLISRALYVELYEKTLIDCLAENNDDMKGSQSEIHDLVADLVNFHRAQVHAARQQVPLSKLVDRLRGYYHDRLMPSIVHYNVK